MNYFEKKHLSILLAGSCVLGGVILGCTNKQKVDVPTSATAVPSIKFAPEKVTFPADYKTKMVSYAAVDRYETKIIRRMYATQKP